MHKSTMGCCCTKSSPDPCPEVVPKETFTTVVENPVSSPGGAEGTPRPTLVKPPSPTLVKPPSPDSSSSSSDGGPSSDGDPWAVVE